MRFGIQTVIPHGRNYLKRFASTASTATAVAAKPTPIPVTSSKVVSKGGSSFLQRLNAFLSGLGLGFGMASYFIYTELERSNEKFSMQMNQIFERLDNLEKR